MDKSFLLVPFLFFGSLPSYAQPTGRLLLDVNHRPDSKQLDIRSLTNPFLIPANQSAPTNPFPERKCLLGDSLECVNRDLAGSGAINCGRVRVGTSPELASNCVLKALSEKKPFFVRYERPSWGGESAIGFTGTADGRVTEVDWDKGELTWPFYSNREYVNTSPCDRLTVLKTGKDGRVECQPLFSRLHRKLWLGVPSELTKVNPRDWQ